MNYADFKSKHTNPIGELSELKLILSSNEEKLELRCRWRLGKVIYTTNERDFEIGATRAFLRLFLEGCESSLDRVYGESDLTAVEESHTIDSGSSVEIGANISVDAVKGIGAGGEANGSLSKKINHLLSTAKTHLPVMALPNDSWKVEPKKMGGDDSDIIEGTAIAGSRLCGIESKSGGNRVSIIGEVQISKSSLRVSAKGGNKLGRVMSEHQNKDAIISQILKLAMQREASTAIPGSSPSVYAVSRSEVGEE